VEKIPPRFPPIFEKSVTKICYVTLKNLIDIIIISVDFILMILKKRELFEPRDFVFSYKLY